MRLASLLITILVTISCSNNRHKSSPSKTAEKTNQVVLIFNKPVQNGSYRNQSRTKNGDEIQFIDDNLIDRRFHLNIGAESDTVVIKSKRDLLARSG